MNSFSVSELCQNAKSLLEDHYPDIWVKGEISNLARPASGHIYFSLKDDSSQVRCALFRRHNLRLTFSPNDGDEVLVHCKVSLYSHRGDFQLICDDMEPFGLGSLQQAYEQLKQKLQKEGLFDLKRKKGIPEYPDSIGIITSPSGAAIKDITKTLERRYPLAKLVIYPSPVQGREAANQLCNALQTATQRKDVDVIILARGGGSLEDLQAFNDELLARTIAMCDIPLVSGIGHETDITIADFVADCRASTPTAAAEMVSPEQYELKQLLDKRELALNNAINQQLQKISKELHTHAKRFRIPALYFSNFRGHVSQFSFKIESLMHEILDKLLTKNHTYTISLLKNTPQEKLVKLKEKFMHQHMLIHNLMMTHVSTHRAQLQFFARQTHHLSPLPTLERGYSITRKKDTKQAIQSIDSVSVGDHISTYLADGEIISQINHLNKKIIHKTRKPHQD